MQIDDRRAFRVILLALILASLLSVKLIMLPGTGPYGADGAFYVNVARHVLEGAGLKTSISMYHYGQTELPTSSRLIYPLWPLLVGLTGRAIGLVAAVNYLPPLFYLLDLILLYLLTNRMTESLHGSSHSVMTAGHLMVLILGLNVQFFGPTTYPYTEGLAFFFCFAAILLMDYAVRSAWPVSWAAAAAVFAGLALLSRTQMVISGIALMMVVIWLALSERRFRGMALSFAAIYGSLFAFWYFAFEKVVESPGVELPHFRMWLSPATTGEWWMERVQGLMVSLAPLHPNSFFNVFQLAFLIPIVAGAIAVIRWLRAQERGLRLPADRVLVALATLVALGNITSLNVYHQDPAFFVPWLFGYRHGLPMVLGVAVGMSYLWGLGKSAKSVAIVCAGVTIAFGFVSIAALATHPPRSSPTPAEAALASWLDTQEPLPVIITAKPQHLSVYTHAPIHWTECRTPASTTRIMLEKLPIDYVIVYATERQCAFIDGLGGVLAERTAFGEGPDRIHVLAPRSARGQPE
jgi:hypothetical protein